MLENHRTGAGYFAGDSEALYEPQYHEKHWSEHADLLIGRRSPTAIVENPMRNMHTISTVFRPCVSPQCPRTKLQWPSNIADAVGRE